MLGYVTSFALVAAIRIRGYIFKSLFVVCVYVTIIVATLIVQRSPFSDTRLDAALVYVQRVLLSTISIPLYILLHSVMKIYNGNLKEERLALRAPIEFLGRFATPLAKLVFGPEENSKCGKDEQKSDGCLQINQP